MNDESNDEQRELEYEIRLALGDDEFETIRVPMSELRPVTTDHRFKRILDRAIEEQKGNWRSVTRWRPAATSKEEYIQNATKIEYVRGLAAKHPTSRVNSNLLAFINGGGLFDGGVCWWHSRFTRSALYLAYFLPTAPRPSEREAKKIIARLMAADEVVAIPGYSNLMEFSNDHRELIQKRLEQTQIVEGVFLFSWINGLAGTFEVSHEKMKEIMDEIYLEVQQNGLAYLKLQIQGISSHAWIMTEMEPTVTGGYMCHYIDSSSMGPAQWLYTPGHTKIDFGNDSDLGVPYLQRTWELRRIKKAIDHFIKNETGG